MELVWSSPLLARTRRKLDADRNRSFRQFSLIVRHQLARSSICSPDFSGLQCEGPVCFVFAPRRDCPAPNRALTTHLLLFNGASQIEHFEDLHKSKVSACEIDESELWCFVGGERHSEMLLGDKNWLLFDLRNVFCGY